MADDPITRNGLVRSEASGQKATDALKELLESRLEEVNRRLDDLNNSHAKAVEERRRTDEAATQVQERTVSRQEFHTWKDDVNRRLDTTAGAAAQTARTWALAGAIGGSIIAGLLVRFWS